MSGVSKKAKSKSIAKGEKVASARVEQTEDLTAVSQQEALSIESEQQHQQHEREVKEESKTEQKENKKESKTESKTEQKGDSKRETEQGFGGFLLDGRLLRSLESSSVGLGLSIPTAVQQRTIPLALQGRDLLLKAPTGSGKTAAYALPVLQRLLSLKEGPEKSTLVPGVRALILVPTRELCLQTRDYFKKLSHYCSQTIGVAFISPDASLAAQKSVLSEQPDVLVTTPSRLLDHLGKTLNLQQTLDILVIDEADLVLSYGYEEDIRKILLELPKTYQAYIISATLSQEIENLKRLVLKNPEVIVVDEEAVLEKPRIAQYVLSCSEEDKFLYIFALLQLNLVEKKVVIFANTVNTAFKLKLFLEKFFIKSVLLNSELPYNSRQHILKSFNKGIYDYLIATDEKSSSQDSNKKLGEHDEDKGTQVEVVGAGNKKRLRAGKIKKDTEYGVSRGFDFQGVKTVINFDFPSESVDSYIHRVGRTARGRMTGTAISFIGPEDGEHLDRVIDYFESKDEAPPKPYSLKTEQITAFRYRCEDVLSSITRSAVREARLREIKEEVLNSDKLKAHFEENPKDLAALRHDTPLLPHELDPSLRTIPSYMPKQVSVAEKKQLPFSVKRKIMKKHKEKQQPSKKSKGDPLRAFEFNPTKK
eukprot:TRINITY_DN8840_c0_g1_i2.p1 TRINITY_DN8840_c0_g1~~TRINITY_DN8840_c0_g1_i2.p1  ORF type:complete len:648 (+),score=161.65 TRINITY_DN8840_c0_g1_i2:43-1986(+)